MERLGKPSFRKKWGVLVRQMRKGGETMNRASRPITFSIVLIFLAAMLIVIMNGCTTPAQKKGNYWNSQIGAAHYNDVVTRLGPPTAKETLSDKSLVAKWVRTSYATVRSEVGSDSWTEEMVMRFSPDGLLTHVTLNEY